MGRTLDVNSSLLASSLRSWRGTVAFRPARRQPAKTLELFEYEASPYCRLVREALTEMDLDAMIYPCPRDGTRFRGEALARGGKQRFPLLVDPNTGIAMFESASIVDYLAETYDAKVRAPRGLFRSLAVAASAMASFARFPGSVRGLRARASTAPAKPLELYSFESSPYSRLVREVLCELEIPYLLRNCGKARWADMGPPWVRDKLLRAPVEGRNRTALLARAGKVQFPFLADPNTGVEMFESAKIIAYLERKYSA
jgi:glutathione S-transferase